METPFQRKLTQVVQQELHNRSLNTSSRKDEAWIVQFEGQNIPMNPTPTERGAHARAKARFFWSWRHRVFFRYPNNPQLFQELTNQEAEKEFNEWYNNHCKAINLI